ncbi:hypothetical protein VLK31_19335 [Variovorax sp. H27-G14]|uniref:hypothetical protein n=1 Tax=Variovorax sp. H27-G14 TaxID=3111914 RepID=UPI0038FC005B
MTNSSFLGGEPAAQYAAGRDVNALGPSDSSDSGSDVQGERTMRGDGDHADELGSLIVDTASDSDASGSGERASATGRDSPDGADISPDHFIGPFGESGNIESGAEVHAECGGLIADDMSTNP